MARPVVALACPIPAERAAFMEWLEGSGYNVLPMVDLDAIPRDMDKQPFEALIADADLVVGRGLLSLIRDLTMNRPLLVIGDYDDGLRSEVERRGASFLARPVGREMFLLGVALSLAEGRPARRSPRRPVPRFPSSLDGVPATMLDVSYEGMRLEVATRHRSTLPPQFIVKVPMFNVSVVAQRVWVGSGLRSLDVPAMWCGATLLPTAPRATTAWRALVDSHRVGGGLDVEAMPFL